MKQVGIGLSEHRSLGSRSKSDQGGEKVVALPNQSRTLGHADEMQALTLLRNTKLISWPRKLEAYQDIHALRRNEGAIRGLQDMYGAMLVPAKPRDVLAIVEALNERYFQVDRDEALSKLLTKEWLEDLSEWPLDLLTKAATNWRKADKGYAPRSAGQLTESVRAEFLERSTMYKKAGDCLRIVGAS